MRYNQLNTEKFIDRAISKHGSKYDYSKVEYTNNRGKVTIICPEHGEFKQIAHHHLCDRGCPTCGEISKRISHRNTRSSNRPNLSHIEVPIGSKAVPVGIKGSYALVDEEDFTRVMEHNWCLVHGYAYNYNIGGMHTLINNPPSGYVTDHINHNRLDNRKENLRTCTRQQNTFNKKLKLGTTSKYKGVTLDKRDNKWSANIVINYKSKYLGRFKSETEAARAYNTAAKKYFGEFAFLNPID